MYRTPVGRSRDNVPPTTFPVRNEQNFYTPKNYVSVLRYRDKKGHYDRVCRSTTQCHYLDQEDDDSTDEGVHFVELNAITTKKKTSEATATFRVHGTAHEITFQIDTGTQCNVIPFSDYVTATGDENGVNLLPTNTVFIMHNKATNKPKGTAGLVLDRNEQG